MWALVVVVALPLCVLAFASVARAGTLQIRDESHVLSPEDVARLRSVVGGLPFDARALYSSKYTDARELDREVASVVSEPNMVVVGVDPQHRHVRVHFGIRSHVPEAAWPDIERAGNDAFRRGDWEQGTAAIFQSAAQAAESTQEGGRDVPFGGGAAAAPRRPSLFGPVVLVLLVAGAVGLLAFVFRRRRTDPYAGPGPGYGPPPGYGGYDPRYPGGYGAPPPPGGIGAMGGGLIGAGLGGLAGYELGKLEGEREERDRLGRDQEGGRRDEGWGGGASDEDRGGNFDAGGGGSDWGDDGGGGGFDGGGGGDGGSDF
jgi:hypothetical protein